MGSYASEALILAAEVLRAPFRTKRLRPPTPLLLRGATSRGGWWNGGCPFPGEPVEPTAGMQGEAISPELNERLVRHFPPGSNAADLERELLGQGFELGRACKKHAVHTAEFQQAGGGFFGPYPIDASVAWKRTPDGRILWTKGRVFYSAP